MKLGFFPLMVIAVLLLLLGEARSQEASDVGASKTRFTLLEDDKGLTINFDGQLFARYNLRTANKPYLWPVIGPTGKSMTRAYPMEDSELEEANQRDHPHQRGILFGHQRISRIAIGNAEDAKLLGGDTWHEELTYAQAKNRGGKLAALATINHREFKLLKASDERAVVVQVCDYLDRDGQKFLQEQRTLTFSASINTRTIDFDQKLIASESAVVLHDSKDAGVAIRVPASMAVDTKKGGHFVNSTGEVDDGAWGKQARWCDYHGPVRGEHLGIAILNHPNSFRFPTRWHVRQYGLFAANPFGSRAFGDKFDDGKTRLKQGDSIVLRHRFIFHRGNAADANIEAAWQQYSKEENADQWK